MKKQIIEAAPGLAVCIALAALAMWLDKVPFVHDTLRFSALLVVILLGILFASVFRLPDSLKPGIRVAQRPVLRWAVAGLGLRLILGDLQQIGVYPLLALVVTVGVSLLAGWKLAEWFGLTRKGSLVLSVGTAVCGASAIVAANSVVEADDSEVATSLGVITLWGTVGIFVYPLIASAVQMTGVNFALWAGGSLHETAQVIAAASGFSVAEGGEVVKLAAAVKLARIALLAPIVFGLGAYLRKTGEHTGDAKVPLVPWFLVMFLIFAVVSTFRTQLGLPDELFSQAGKVVTFLMAVGMAGVGLQTSVRDLKAAGIKPVAAGFGQWVIIAVISLALIYVINH